ncbi:MAG: DUF4422 domain-containing protein [Eubacteriales bacterium]|nr:DUF4422 domain-containing protein [Eubacteriales bacterium]
MIYIATHKKFKEPKLDGYKPIQVGASNKNKLGYITDDTGINISNKNANFCELTGLYWIWKNSSDEYKGLVHYRRYFSNTLRKKIITAEDVKKILKKYDVILPFKHRMNNTLVEDYCEISGYKSDLDKVRQIISMKFPNYLNTYDEVMEGNDIYFYNMIVAKKEVFDSYCNWLFTILFELESKVDLEGYNDYQKRIYGFMSERLLNVYFRYNSYKIFECGVINTEEKWSKSKVIRTSLKRKIMYCIQLLK